MLFFCACVLALRYLGYGNRPSGAQEGGGGGGVGRKRSACGP